MKMCKLLLICVLLVLFSVPVTAQDEVPGPGEGDPIIFPNLGGDIRTINPILSADGSSNRINSRLFPDFLGIDPDTISLEPGVAGSLVTGFDVSEDGMVYTFYLRDDWTWSDGTQITAVDYKYAFDAINTIDTPFSYVLDDIADVLVIDDYTVEIMLTAPVCSALNNIADVPVVPAHIYSERFPSFEDMIDSDHNQPGAHPGATANRWTYGSFRPGEQMALLADQNFPDAIFGHVVPGGWIDRNIEDQTLIVESFLLNEITYLQSAPADRKDEIRELAAAGEAQLWEAPAGTVRFVAVNLADPNDPRPGLDADGNAIDQGHHWALGDLSVRHALMHAIDWEGLNEGAMNGEGIQLASHFLPTSWAYDETIPFYEFDPDRAAELLEEAGWVMGDSGARVAQGAPYAEDGTRLTLEFITNAGNTENERLALLLADMWGDVGVELDVQIIDFNILVETLQAQTFDLVLIFWNFGVPAEPNSDIRVTFDPANDLPGAGFNVVSYNNPELQELLAIANDADQTNGCDTEIRTELYREAYQILRDDVPWIWVGTSIVTSAMQPYVANFDPKLGGLDRTFWNEDAYVIQPEAR